MIGIKHPFSIWLQISCFSFFLAGNYSDLLIVRLCLSSAYVFLLLNSVLGAPMWPNLELPDQVQLDGIVWALLNLYVHVSTIVRLLNDEKSVELSRDEQALWRMFYRTGGLSQMMFKKTIAEYCIVVKYNKDSTIPTDEFFYIVYKGTVKIHVTDDNGMIVSSRKAQSGQLFDFRALGLLQDIQSLAKHKIEKVVALSDVTLFRFRRDQMPTIAKHHATRLMWKELLMENLLRIVQRYFEHRLRRGNMEGRDYMNPIFLPLQPWERPDPLRPGSGAALRQPLWHIFASMQWSFSPPWPFKGPLMGLRHSQLPAPGRVQNVPPRKLLDTSESDFLMSESSMSYESLNSTIEGENEEFLDYMLEIDEEMGGMNSISFSPPVPIQKEVQ